MLQLPKSSERWWQKPLAVVDDNPVPAELAVLWHNLGPDEAGVWLNSRGTRTGVVDLVRDAEKGFRTVRIPLPSFVSDILRSLYEATGLSKGAPDLVVWNESKREVRFIEVKCPHWDRPSPEQATFLRAAEARGINTTIREWEFDPVSP